MTPRRTKLSDLEDLELEACCLAETYAEDGAAGGQTQREVLVRLARGLDGLGPDGALLA